MPRATRKPKPTFDVARDPVADTRSGWVYRSDRPADRVTVLPASTPAGVPVVRDRFQPDAPLEPAPRSWFATGVYLMVLPVTVGMSLMLAPVSWLLGARSRR